MAKDINDILKNAPRIPKNAKEQIQNFKKDPRIKRRLALTKFEERMGKRVLSPKKYQRFRKYEQNNLLVVSDIDLSKVSTKQRMKLLGIKDPSVANFHATERDNLDAYSVRKYAGTQDIIGTEPGTMQQLHRAEKAHKYIYDGQIDKALTKRASRIKTMYGAEFSKPEEKRIKIAKNYVLNNIATGDQRLRAEAGQVANGHFDKKISDHVRRNTLRAEFQKPDVKKRYQQVKSAYDYRIKPFMDDDHQIKGMALMHNNHALATTGMVGNKVQSPLAMSALDQDRVMSFIKQNDPVSYKKMQRTANERGVKHPDMGDLLNHYDIDHKHIPELPRGRNLTGTEMHNLNMLDGRKGINRTALLDTAPSLAKAMNVTTGHALNQKHHDHMLKENGIFDRGSNHFMLSKNDLDKRQRGSSYGDTYVQGLRLRNTGKYFSAPVQYMGMVFYQDTADNPKIGNKELEASPNLQKATGLYSGHYLNQKDRELQTDMEMPKTQNYDNDKVYSIDKKGRAHEASATQVYQHSNKYVKDRAPVEKKLNTLEERNSTQQMAFADRETAKAPLSIHDYNKQRSTIVGNHKMGNKMDKLNQFVHYSKINMKNAPLNHRVDKINQFAHSSEAKRLSAMIRNGGKKNNKVRKANKQRSRNHKRSISKDSRNIKESLRRSGRTRARAGQSRGHKGFERD